MAAPLQVFVGPPFHAVPLARYVDYASMAIFVSVDDTDLWINRTSIRWEQNHMVSGAMGRLGVKAAAVNLLAGKGAVH